MTARCFESQMEFEWTQHRHCELASSNKFRHGVRRTGLNQIRERSITRAVEDAASGLAA